MEPSKHVNIDGDVINYAVGFASQRTLYEIGGKRFEDKASAIVYALDVADEEITTVYEAEPVAFALSSCKRLIKRIKEESKATSATILLTGEGNFRDAVATIQPYKGNRDGSSKPLNFQSIRDYLLFVAGAEMVEGEEADDQLSIRAVRDGATIATIDKDLDNTAGWHYNWQRDTLYYVTEVQADRNFYRQLFVGDTTDHIPGLFRVTGQRATAKIKAPLDEMKTPREMYEHVRDVYAEAAPELDVAATLLEIGRLLWMRRSDGEMWSPPNG